MKKEIRKLTVTGSGQSYYVTIPRWMIQELNWQKRQKVEVRLSRGRIVILDWEKASG